MDCKRVEELIPLFVEGDLDRPRAEQVESHILACNLCGDQLSRYEASQAWLRTFEPPDLDDAVAERVRRSVMQQIAQRGARKRIFEWPRMWLMALGWTAPWRLAAAGAALVIVLFALALLWSATRHGSSIPEQATLSGPRSGGGDPNQTVRRTDRPVPTEGTSAPERHIAVTGKARPRRHAVSRTKEGDDQARIPGSAPQDPRLTALDQSDASHLNDGKLRIEIQTADPNIRIIWFAPKETDEALRPMGETR